MRAGKLVTRHLGKRHGDEKGLVKVHSVTVFHVLCGDKMSVLFLPANPLQSLWCSLNGHKDKAHGSRKIALNITFFSVMVSWLQAL